MAKVWVPFSCYSVIYKWLILVISVKTEIKGSRILVFSRCLTGWEGKERNEPNYADSGTDDEGICFLSSYELELSLSWVWVKIESSSSYQKMPLFPQKMYFHLFCFSLFLVCLYFCCCVVVICTGSYAPATGNETLYGRMLLERTVLYTCSVRVRFFDLLFQTCVQNCVFLVARYPVSSLVLTDVSS